ncbi:gluconate 2-dehydrogenase subunit 3 family protein [Gallaecimonas mangrovi]|uniref:gluconate 2-dehydrogenase subunit 3 family protein n=1 Tax=Gallaecimonas mangrovi TaxID=2291597 RepID=UPI000E206DC2|nr:gluconate 2-dehydrogenase subunit 3 family protein [Gallaecimonas mangrovi]
MKRRDVLKAGLVVAGSATVATVLKPRKAEAKVFEGGTKWQPATTPLPKPVDPSKLVFFTQDEAKLVSALFDRLIPADDLSIGATQAGCVTFIDHQLAGNYGKGTWMYRGGPVEKGIPQAGDQSIMVPADIYRQGLAEIDSHCRQSTGKAFTELSDQDKDTYLEQMEAGKHPYQKVPSQKMFSHLLANVQEGFFADPIYGGNRGMVGWKMIGFPGARYDYRDVVHIKGKKIELEPVSLVGPI